MHISPVIQNGDNDEGFQGQDSELLNPSSLLCVTSSFLLFIVLIYLLAVHVNM